MSSHPTSSATGSVAPAHHDENQLMVERREKLGALVVMVGSIVNIFVGSTAGMMAISVAVIGIFSAYMLYDLKQILDGGETNYISATLRLYLDLFNVFQALLALLGIMGGERD